MEEKEMILMINNTVEVEIDSFRECLENDTATEQSFIYLEIKKYQSDKTILQALKPFIEKESITSLAIFKDGQMIYDFSNVYNSISRAHTMYDEELNQIVTTIILE